MILEHVVLPVVPGKESDFDYLLLVEWERLEDHTEGFRGSAEYQQWRQLLHHFYEPFPTVDHFQQIA
jgi:heme-degrading monooxygenase HmoA